MGRRAGVEANAGGRPGLRYEGVLAGRTLHGLLPRFCGPKEKRESLRRLGAAVAGSAE
jgi:hypothetical protein